MCNSSATKLDPTASQSFPLHMQLRLSLMAERHIQIFKSSLLQVNLRILLLNICAWLNCCEKNVVSYRRKEYNRYDNYKSNNKREKTWVNILEQMDFVAKQMWY